MQSSNRLLHESSPYLLQHAHNPVDWFPWGEEAFSKAKKENKLVLVSIGYSACHWCHVMEHESFEDARVADIMNQHFVCIKVDREERPDIDQIYMLAVQIMTGQGGWPLNCFTLPDGRPIYGGTYFPKHSWTDILQQLSAFYKNNPAKAEEYAGELTQGLHKAELIHPNPDGYAFSKDILKDLFYNWQSHFDLTEGGPNRAPKFPLPNNYQFLLQYATLNKSQPLFDYINLTLSKMAMGGIYDQLGGGFARYSTDYLWKVPHFEKMLYDNAQLVSLYNEAFQATQNPLYRQVVYETLAFADRELTSPEGSFYSALDADSEGEEGKYYVWTKEELQNLLGNDFALFADYYNVNEKGLWEDNYILLRDKSDEVFAKQHHISMEDLQKNISHCKALLLQERSKRVRPGLDDKQLTSWNALMIKAYADAYSAFAESAWLEKAVKAAGFIFEKCTKHDGGFFHSYKNGKATVNGLLEDYCFMIEALIALYQASGQETWLYKAEELMQYTLKHFHDPLSGMFFFTPDDHETLIARKTEINDNVIPASNSCMAKNLFLLGQYFGNSSYTDKAKAMLHNVQPNMARYGSGYSNWAQLLCWLAFPFHEIAISGPQAMNRLAELNKTYIPNKLVAVSTQESSVPLLQDRFDKQQTSIYVCVDNTCKLPVDSVPEALSQIK